MMKQVVFISFLALSSLFAASSEFASSMNYHTSYESALKEAQKTNKPIMMVVSTKTCPWCRKLEHQTLKRKIVHDIVSTNFTPLVLTRGEDTYPLKFDAKVVPTTFFIDPKTTNIIHKIRGYKNKKVFKKLLENVIQNTNGK